MIATKNLKHKYQNTQEIVFPDLTCDAKEILLILGTSGVGKTTLLHLLGGLISVQSGEITIENKKINDVNGKALDQFRGKNIGIIFQNNHFVQSLNVIENLELAQSLAGNNANKSLCQDLLNRLNIGHKAKSEIKHLSQGERQRVAIARALVNSPKVVLADEPTSALDDKNCDEVLQLLQEQAQAIGSSLIIVTHDTRLKEKISNQVTLQ